MKIGVGLPSTIPGARPDVILEWAKRADAAGFSSLAVIDRLVYPNLEPLVALSAAAAVTGRIRLLTAVLLAPLRNTGVLAKQLASLDVLSGGRLTLGLGVGAREDDFVAAPAAYQDRGRRFDIQMSEMKRIWSGLPSTEGGGLVGPTTMQAGGPEVLIGGSTPRAIQRVGVWGDGFIAIQGSPELVRSLYQIAETAWKEKGRQGRPRFVGNVNFALGPTAAAAGPAFLRNYYGFFGPGVDRLLNVLCVSDESVQTALQAYADIGMDELIFWPCIPEVEQLGRLASLVA